MLNVVLSISIFIIICAYLLVKYKIIDISREKTAQQLLTAEFVSNAIKMKVKKVIINDIAKCGDGKASTTDRIFITVHTMVDDNTKQQINMVCKMILLPRYLRIGTPFMIKLSSIITSFLYNTGLDLDKYYFYLMNFYNKYLSHAPDTMYQNEAFVYRQIIPKISDQFIHPKCYGTIIDDSRAIYVIFMQDLIQPSIEIHFPNATESLSMNYVQNGLSSLAAFHAKFWDIDPNDDRYKDIPTMSKGGMYTTFHYLGKGLIRDHCERNEFQKSIIAPLGLNIDELWNGLLKCNQILNTKPLTICHGDCHIQNTFINYKSDKLGFFDFQLTIIANFVRDISYFIVTSISVESRRKYEHELLKYYLQCLKDKLKEGKNESVEIPSFEETWELYSKGVIWGLVIGWLICPSHNYGKEIWKANVDRLIQAVIDLKSFQKIGIYT